MDLLRALQFGLLLVVARLHCRDLRLQIGLHEGGEALVGLAHLGGGVIDHALRLADGLFNLAQPGFELFQRGVNRLDATPNRLLRALTHSFEPFGDFLGGGCGGVHRALGGVRAFRGVGVHLGEDAVHLCQTFLVPLRGLGNGVGRKHRREHLPLITQELKAGDQRLHHEDARLADDLELFGQPRPDLPADDGRSKHAEGHTQLADRGNRIGHRQIGRGPRCCRGAGRRHRRRARRLPRGDQRRDQAVDQHREADLGDAPQPLHHRVQVLRQPRQRLSELLGEARGFVQTADPLPEGVGQAGEGLTDGHGQLGVLGG